MAVEMFLKPCFSSNFLKSFIFWQSFSSTQAVIELLERAPIISEFDVKKDKKTIIKVQEQLTTKKGIILSSHRLHWVARKS